MKMKLSASLVGLMVVVSGLAFAARVRDWPELRRAHNHLQQAINELDKARAANHYDMQGHGAKAVELTRQAEAELRQSIEAIHSEH